MSNRHMMYWENLDKPRDLDIHSIVDFMELLCITALDRELSIEDLHDHLGDFGLNINDNKKSDILEHLKWRASTLGDYYPFVVKRQFLSMSPDDISDLIVSKKYYLLLLLAANLPFIEHKYRNDFTESFEVFSKKCLDKFWNFPSAKTVSFGKNQSEFKGLKHERLNKLFNSMGHIGRYEENDFRSRDSGDGGIDLAAWVELDNCEPTNNISIIIQCACSRQDILTKQLEVSENKFSRHIQMGAPWLSALFTPVLLRDNHGRWAINGELTTITLLDRLRLLKLAPNNCVIGCFPVYFDEMLRQERDTTS